jgi:hypothetical protein
MPASLGRPSALTLLRRASQNDFKEQIVLLPPGRHSRNVFADSSILAMAVKPGASVPFMVHYGSSQPWPQRSSLGRYHWFSSETKRARSPFATGSSRWTRRNVGRSEWTCYGHNGVGQQACRCAARWDAACGRYGLIFQEIELPAY